MKKPWIVPMEPKMFMDTPIGLILFIPALSLYWCPTAFFIWEIFTGNPDKTLWIPVVWGGIATIVFMTPIIRIIRGIAWTRRMK